MKKVLALIMSLILIVPLAACGESGVPTRAPQNQETTAPSGSQAPITTAAPQTEPQTKPPHVSPQTAQFPPAQTLKEMTHLSGVTEIWVDPASGREYLVWEDLGEDGHTRTMNCFDDDGQLLWWETFEYDEEEQPIRKYRLDPDKTHVLMKEELYYENGVLVRMEHYDGFYPEGDQLELSLTREESYFPNGNVNFCVTFYPVQIYGVYALEHQYEYDENGQELHHILFDPYGGIMEESYYGEKVIQVPDSVGRIYDLLNGTREEDFEKVWTACMEKIAKKNMTEDWEALCRDFSAVVDEYDGSALYRLREEYGLGLFLSSRAGSLYRFKARYRGEVVTSVKDGTVNPLLRERIYRPNCWLDFGGTLWLTEEYEQRMSELAGSSFEPYARADGDPIRILVVDDSSTIRGDEINAEIFSDKKQVERIVERAETMLSGLFAGKEEEQLILVSYPEAADVVIRIDTAYPFAGQYKYSDGTIANVWNTVVTLTAYDMRGAQGAEQRSVTETFKHLAGETVTTYGGTLIYMNVPDLTEVQYLSAVQAFVETIFSWFPDVAP